MTRRFTKMQGLGNDFVVVDRRSENAPPPPEVCVRVCDRHFGVGADGVLSVMTGREAAIAMHVTNADGSVAEMCGNGLRCVVRWAVDRGLLPAEGGAVETGRGVLHCRVDSDGQVCVDMGAPVLDAALVPVTADGDRFIDGSIDLGDRTLDVSAVSMGNPHAVHFVDDPAVDLRALATTLGPVVERHPRFPRRTNAEFARLTGPREIALVVWERGSGLTLACGTGACATVVAAVLTGRASAGEEILVTLPGGPLRVRVEPDLSRVWMTGPAVEVFEGVLPA